ncbi:DUF5675 family protein [[Flexibacter] sp. ATCC 35208]|uniref:DUF5675 family protein n=1 Tax=[Flexibacter] sp. ATCC 35208 TaxID=1936242 RepID=UPI0009C92A30|nr:DUF5675 family protein [[Flexibacter] sp. ATCC 35208]OMP78208.1 hypothetical protein BW716_15650 [[Flexibacter] sp. ATCC 35208]
MELLLMREYFDTGTNGALYMEGHRLCYTIELPWKENHVGCSCIPEGRYTLRKRFSERKKWHLEVLGVQGRSLILIHPANNAMKELQGCIAPVTSIHGEGLGYYSVAAMDVLRRVVYMALDAKEQVFLTIKKKQQ